MSIEFHVEARAGSARAGRLITPHGEIETPVFMPVGTVATVKGVPQDVLEELGVQILLGNTYHLYLRPGVETVRQMGGLHGFMSWPRAILTDSGGFQVFSLNELRKVTEDGVTFRSHLDGSSHFFSPESAMQAQIGLGADIIMAFDECTEFPMDRELRKESAERTIQIGFPGYAIGGLSVGEPRELTREMVESTLEHLPADKPRYVMGVGTPEEIVEYAKLGVDMMDCVLPTRAARHGLLFTSEGRVSIKQARYAKDPGPLDPNCACSVCQRYSRAYLRHLYASNEMLAQVLNTIHNLSFYLDTMRRVRHAISLGEESRFLSGDLSRAKP